MVQNYEKIQELLPVSERGGKKAVSARRLYGFLGLNKTQWKRWYEKNIIKNPYAVENEDWIGFDIMSNGNESKDFALSINFAKKLSMQAKTDKGELARDYFLWCEQRLKEVSKPLSTLDLLELTIKGMRENQQELQEVKKEVLELKAKTATRPDYFTIVGYGTLHGIHVGLTLAAALGRKATGICKARGIETDRIPDPRFGEVKMYPAFVLDEVFEQSLRVKGGSL
jgi:phage anti-repressor protein